MTPDNTPPENDMPEDGIQDDAANDAANDAKKAEAKAQRKVDKQNEIKSELKKMELCESCAGIQRNWRKAPGHPELVQGDNRHETRRHGLVAITSYRCDRCGTRWEYENNKADQKIGWSVVGR